MFTFLTSTATAALFASLLAQPSRPATAQVSLMALVPEDSFALVHCPDFAALRSRAARNDWFRLLSSESGAPLLVELANEFHAETHTDLDELLALGNELTGESLFFTTREVSGFVSVPPADRKALADSMRAWLPDPGAETVSNTLRLGDATVEVVAWPSGEWRNREGHFAAFVDHPLVLGLFSGDSSEALMTTLKASLAGLGSERRAPVVSGYEAARAGKPSCLGIEAFVDFSPFAAEAERELKSEMEGFLPDPSGMLGIDQGLWLLSANDIFPGSRIDCQAWLNVPKDTLAADLADTFQPLPSDLPAQLPNDLSSLWALHWDIAGFYRRLRAAYVERHGAQSLRPVDELLSAAKGMSGVDPITEVIEQLGGTFAFYEVQAEDGAADGLEFERFGLLATLVNGEAFLDAFERLLEIGPLDSELDLVELEGVDVYTFGDDADDGGLAILPRALVLGLDAALTRALRAATGIPDANLLDGSDMHAAFDQNLGCCFFSCQRLSAWEAAARRKMNGTFELPPEEGQEQGRNPFDSLLVYTARRTPDGFRFELHTR